MEIHCPLNLLCEISFLFMTPPKGGLRDYSPTLPHPISVVKRSHDKIIKISCIINILFSCHTKMVRKCNMEPLKPTKSFLLD